MERGRALLAFRMGDRAKRPANDRAMGAGTAQYLWLVAREARLPLLVAVMAGFGSVISEVGASSVVGNR